MLLHCIFCIHFCGTYKREICAIITLCVGVKRVKKKWLRSMIFIHLYVHGILFGHNVSVIWKGVFVVVVEGCPDPQFNAQTVLTPPTSQFILDSSVVVSCATGYAFSSEAFQDPNIQNRFEPLSQVTLRCLEGGKWNLPILPECERE